MIPPPRKAAVYKRNFNFLADRISRFNAAYHLQFIEYCWRLNARLVRTTRSLMNRTLMVELASIVELVLNDVLSSLKVSGHGLNTRPIHIPIYLTLDKLIDLARYYDLLNDALAEDLRDLNTARNSIHFKKFNKARVLEHDYYRDAMVHKAIQTFEAFLNAIHNKIHPHRKPNFVYPWSTSNTECRTQGSEICHTPGGPDRSVSGISEF